MKHIFMVLILLIGISTMVLGQIDTLAILEDDTSKTTTDVIYLEHKKYDGEYTDKPINSMVLENNMAWFFDLGGGYSIFQNKNFLPKSYSNANLQMCIGMKISSPDDVLLLKIPFGFSLPGEPFLFGNIGRLENATTPSFYRGYFELKGYYLRKLKNSQHFIGAEFNAGNHGKMFADTSSTSPYTTFVDTHDIGLWIATIGVAYIYQTSIKNKPLNIYFSLPLFFTHSGAFGKRFSEDEYYFYDVGTLNKHLAPTLEVELASPKRKTYGTGWSIAYECRLRSVKHSTRTAWINDFTQALSLRYYFSGI